MFNVCCLRQETGPCCERDRTKKEGTSDVPRHEKRSGSFALLYDTQRFAWCAGCNGCFASCVDTIEASVLIDGCMIEMNDRIRCTPTAALVDNHRR